MKNTKYDKTLKYLEGDPVAPTAAEVSEWLCDPMAEPDAGRALHDFWQQLPENEHPLLSREAFDRFCRSVGQFSSAPSAQWHRLGRYARMAQRAAALVAIPLFLVCTLLLLRTPAADVEWCEFSVAAGCTDSLILPDGSRVWLNAGSRLFYPQAFYGEQRKVFLAGEAYFDVARDTAHPFVVGAGNVKVRVLGTQFNITSYDDMRSVLVCLIEGSVRLDVDHGDVVRDLLLVPGDVVRYDRISGSLEQQRLPAEAYLSWRNGGFYFSNQSLGEIVAQFERVFGVKIFIADEAARAMRYSLAFVNGEGLDRMLEAIAGDELRVVREQKMIVIRTK